MFTHFWDILCILHIYIFSLIDNIQVFFILKYFLSKEFLILIDDDFNR